MLSNIGIDRQLDPSNIDFTVPNCIFGRPNLVFILAELVLQSPPTRTSRDRTSSSTIFDAEAPGQTRRYK